MINRQSRVLFVEVETMNQLKQMLIDVQNTMPHSMNKHFRMMNRIKLFSSFSFTSQRRSNGYRRPVQINNRTKYEHRSIPNIHHYSPVRRPQNHDRYSSTNHHHSYQYDTLQQSTYNKINPTQIIIPNESYQLSRNNPYIGCYDTSNTSPYCQQPSQNTADQTSNYFQPVRDPLEALLQNPSQLHPKQQKPIPTYTNMSEMQPFDLGSLINRIQQDYVDNVRPYVSSVEFVENEQRISNIDLITPMTHRKGFIVFFLQFFLFFKLMFGR